MRRYPDDTTEPRNRHGSRLGQRTREAGRKSTTLPPFRYSPAHEPERLKHQRPFWPTHPQLLLEPMRQQLLGWSRGPAARHLGGYEPSWMYLKTRSSPHRNWLPIPVLPYAEVLISELLGSCCTRAWSLQSTRQRIYLPLAKSRGEKLRTHKPRSICNQGFRKQSVTRRDEETRRTAQRCHQQPRVNRAELQN